MTGSPMSDYGYPMPFAAPRQRVRTSVAGLGVAVIVLLALDAAVAALAAGLLVWRHQVLGRLLADPTSVDPAEIRDSDRLSLAAAGWFYIFAVATVIVFICWFWAARTNAEAYAPNRATLPIGWVIGGWCIPLANWVLPLLVARDVYRGTMFGRKGKPTGGGQITGWWWGPFVIAQILALVCKGENSTAKKATDFTDFVHDLQSVAATGIAALIATIVAALPAIGYVRTITKTQNARNREGDWYGGPGPSVLAGPYGMYGYGYGAPMPGYPVPPMPMPMPMPMPPQPPAPPTQTAPAVQNRVPVADTQIADTQSAEPESAGAQSTETQSADVPKPEEPGDWLTPPN